MRKRLIRRYVKYRMRSRDIQIEILIYKYKRYNLVPGFGNLVGLLFFCVFFYGTLKKMRKPKEAEYTRKRGCRYVCD